MLLGLTIVGLSGQVWADVLPPTDPMTQVQARVVEGRLHVAKLRLRDLATRCPDAVRTAQQRVDALSRMQRGQRWGAMLFAISMAMLMFWAGAALLRPKRGDLLLFGAAAAAAWFAAGPWGAVYALNVVFLVAVLYAWRAGVRQASAVRRMRWMMTSLAGLAVAGQLLTVGSAFRYHAAATQKLPVCSESVGAPAL